MSLAKSILITGASTGIGFALALETAKLGFTVYVTSRSKIKSEDAVQRLVTGSGLSQASFVACDALDLDDLDGIREFVKNFPHKLDFLVLNAGLMKPKKEITKDGIEVTYAGKVIGHHVLTMELTKKGSLGPNATIIFVGSEVSTGFIQGMKLIDFKSIANAKTKGDMVAAYVATMKGDESIAGTFNPPEAYATANVLGELWCLSLAQRFAQKDIKIFAVSPGAVLDTQPFRHFSWLRQKVTVIIQSLMYGNQTPEEAIKNRFLPIIETPEKFENGRFYASPLGKLDGPLTLQESAHLIDKRAADEVVQAIEIASGTPSSV